MNTQINPIDIPDLKIREWYRALVEKHKRQWIMPIWNGLLEQECYLPWVLREIISDDSIVFLTIDPEAEKKLNAKLKDSSSKKHRTIVSNRNLSSEDFFSIINENEIDSFFSHANFSNAVLMMRNELLSKRLFNKVLPIWHEGGFLRPVCFQLDWMGWNALSSLAAMDLTRIPALSPSQQDFLEYFMNEVFIRNKIYFAKRAKIFTSTTSVKRFFNTKQPLVVIPLQVHRDSVVVHFSPEKYLSLSWAFEFTGKHPDYFFVIIDHPKQRNFDHIPTNTEGTNWIYISHNTGIDTTTLCKYADAVVTVNSTAGFEALYWTPIFRAGKSVYSHDLISHNIQDFPHDKLDQNDINRFLYYAITQFHYTPQINSNSHKEWFSVLQENRSKYYLPKIPHKNPLLPKPSIKVPDYNFLVRPDQEYTGRAGQIAEYFAENFVIPYSEILDVGGGSTHFAEFLYNTKRAKTTIVDIRPIRSNNPSISSVQINFADYSSDKKFDGIWTCHVAEHIPNLGQFLKNLVNQAAESAVFAIIVPQYNKGLVGGHINIFSPATLCYNVILAGQNLNTATVIVQENNIALLWKRDDFELPTLKYDKGDIEILQDRFPRPVSQGVDAFSAWENIRTTGFNSV